MDLSKWPRHKAVIILTLIVFVLGIPSALSGSRALFPNWEVIFGKSFFETMVDLISVWLLPISGLLVTLFTGWRFDKALAKKQFELGSKWKGLFTFWYFMVRFIAPIFIILIIVQSLGINLDALIYG